MAEQDSNGNGVRVTLKEIYAVLLEVKGAVITQTEAHKHLVARVALLEKVVVGELLAILAFGIKVAIVG